MASIKIKIIIMNINIWWAVTINTIKNKNKTANYMVAVVQKGQKSESNRQNAVQIEKRI